VSRLEKGPYAGPIPVFFTDRAEEVATFVDQNIEKTFGEVTHTNNRQDYLETSSLS